MVLTRSERNRLLSLGISEEAISNMQSVPNTLTEPVITTTAPVVSNASIPAMATATAVITPAVQQFMTMARDNSSGNRSHVSATSIASPEYSSITARNGGQVEAARRPPPAEGAALNNDMVGTLREEFSQQLQELQRSLQEIARTVFQRTGQTTAANYNAPAPPQAPLQPLTQPNCFRNDAPIQANLDNSYARHFRPVRAPQYAEDFGRNSSPFEFRPEYHHSPSVRVDLSKWGIKFDGTTKSMSAEDFMFRVDVLRQDYNCTFNDILRSFHLLLEGQALDWYWNVRKLTPIRSWQDLETAFLTQYRRYESEFQIQKKIMDRRQMPQESFEDFYNAVLRLRNQQRTPYTERDLIEIMRSNLKPAMSHLLFSVRFESLGDFCQQAKRAESLLCNQRPQYQQRNFPPQRVNELAYEEDILPDTGPEVEALATSGSYTCWNCRQAGHSFMDCPSPNRRVFCFRCGRDNVVTPKCPKCQGNIERNKPRPGQARSTQT